MWTEDAELEVRRLFDEYRDDGKCLPIHIL